MALRLDMYDYFGYDAELIGAAGYDEVLPLIKCGQAKRLPKDPKTVIVCLFPYYVGETEQKNLARYAWLDDYHDIAGELLLNIAGNLKAKYKDEEFVCFTDNSPIREVAAAHICGLGAVGGNGMLINKRYGSYVFIGSIVTSAVISTARKEAGECPGCGKCFAACPTGALKQGKPFDKNICRSYITQKKRGLSDFEKRQIKLGGLVFGCDICGDVCPLNKDAEKTPVKAFYNNITPVINAGNADVLLGKKPYGWRGKDVIMRNLALLEE